MNILNTGGCITPVLRKRVEMKRIIAFEIETSEDGDYCLQSCKHAGGMGDWCYIFGTLQSVFIRCQECLDSEITELATAEHFDCGDIADVRENVRCMDRIYQSCLKRWCSKKAALCCYNGVLINESGSCRYAEKSK